MITPAPDGTVHWMAARGRCYCDAAGNVTSLEGIVQNMDARRQAEEVQRRHQTEVEALNQRLRRAMTETHHRVVNNLQVISAMIDLQTMEDATLTSDQGTSLALIANEIYSNAIKHGNSEVNIHFYIPTEARITPQF